MIRIIALGGCLTMTQTCAITLPPHFSSLTIGEKKFEFWVLQGTGLADNVWSETNIGSSRNGYGQVASVHSSSTTKREFWVRLPSGKEKQVALPDNTSFAVREGHQLSLICMKCDFLSTDSFYYMAVTNHTTDAMAILDNNWMIKRFAGLEKSQGVLNLFVLFTLGTGLIPIALYGNWINDRYGKSINQRVGDVASFLFKQGFQASQS